MNQTLKSRDYHRSYQKWDALLMEGKLDELIITPGAKSEIFFALTLKKKAKNNSTGILQALEQLPKNLPALNDIRKDYDAGARL